jgi:HAD superfamily hydrolase (TIGR01484 family)
MKIQAIFSDYDGTLSSIEVPREKAFVPPKLFHALESASRKVPIVIITTKDLKFVSEKVPFAHAIAATCGLELQIGTKLISDKRAKENLSLVNEAYSESLDVVSYMKDNIVVETKTTHKGDLMGFCLDWRASRNWRHAHNAVRPLVAKFRGRGLHVVESKFNPFVDIYAIKVEKGSAFLRLKHELGLNSPIMYLGDSEMDNPAFELAEVPIGIKHKESSPTLQCAYYVEFHDLEPFISRLLAANLNFVPEMIKRTQ